MNKIIILAFLFAIGHASDARNARDGLVTARQSGVELIAQPFILAESINKGNANASRVVNVKIRIWIANTGNESIDIAVPAGNKFREIENIFMFAPAVEHVADFPIKPRPTDVGVVKLGKNQAVFLQELDVARPASTLNNFKVNIVYSVGSELGHIANVWIGEIALDVPFRLKNTTN